MSGFRRIVLCYDQILVSGKGNGMLQGKRWKNPLNIEDLNLEFRFGFFKFFFSESVRRPKKRQAKSRFHGSKFWALRK